MLVHPNYLLTSCASYAHKYQCPQVFCFDGSYLLLLQFRATKLEKLEDEDCPVDVWLFSRTHSACPLRYALYRLLVQGWRRCQGSMAGQLTVGGLTTNSWQFYSGRPTWKVNGVKQVDHPSGYQRSVDVATGSMMWKPEGSELPAVVETWPVWGSQTNT